MGKYEDWLENKAIPARMSVLELSVLAQKLGVDVDAIQEKYMDALYNELLEAVKAKGIVQQK